MEIKQLSTFKVVAHTLSFSQAAENLNYAQSTVTAQIQSLEKELGTPLFNRLGKRITLTDAGQQLLDYAERLTRMEEEARMVVAHSEEEPAGPLLLGIAETIIAYHLPGMLRQFRQRYPAVQLTFLPYESGRLIELAQSGEADLVLLYRDRIIPPNLDYEDCTTDRVLLVVAPDHPLAKQRSFSPGDLGAENLLLTDKTCPYRRSFDHMLGSFGIVSQPKMEFTSTTAIKQCVLAGLGVGWLPEVALRAELDSGDLVALNWLEDDLMISAMVAWHQDKWMSPAAHAFRQMLRETILNRSVPQMTIADEAL